MYEFKSRVRYSEIGPDKHLTLPSIINYFQDCSTFQSEALGVGLAYLEKEHRAWILNSWQINIADYPYLGDDITISTWAYDFKGTYGNRNFLLKGANDTVYASANSIWIYMDTKNSRMLRVPKEMAARYGMEEAYKMEYAPRKIALPDTLEEKDGFPVLQSNLDTNHHVNNEEYVKMAAAYLPAHFIVGRMRAEYRSSAVLGDEIIPYTDNQPNVCTIALCNRDHAIYAIIEFTRKDS
ncbi:MAG: hypothetical protein PWP24_1923 [Clostridiales bacterium]|nr:hypothetical protein [Clostridiales bacterium]